MARDLLKIGEHLIQVLCDSVQCSKLFGATFQKVGGDHQPDMMIELEGAYGVPFVDYDVEITRESNKIFFRRADYLVQVDAGYRSARISYHDQLALKHALMNLYSSLIVHHNWGLLIHSSCALEGEKAHIFAGQSGAGKSTVARLSQPRGLLSDEATIVKIDGERITVFDSPFRSELETTHYEESRPLASVQLLYQSDQNERMRLKKSDALLHLIDKVFYWPNSPDATNRIIASLKELVNTVPVYKLHFQKNNAFWELIS